MSCGIYKITNKVNGKAYIGQSKNIEYRFSQHKLRSNWKDKSNKVLYKAFIKYGVENFEFEILDECNWDDINDIEVRYIQEYNTYNNGYNCTRGGEGKTGGRVNKIYCLDTKEMFWCATEAAYRFGINADVVRSLLNLNISRTTNLRFIKEDHEKFNDIINGKSNICIHCLRIYDRDHGDYKSVHCVECRDKMKELKYIYNYIIRKAARKNKSPKLKSIEERINKFNRKLVGVDKDSFMTLEKIKKIITESKKELFEYANTLGISSPEYQIVKHKKNISKQSIIEEFSNINIDILEHCLKAISSIVNKRRANDEIYYDYGSLCIIRECLKSKIVNDLNVTYESFLNETRYVIK